MQDPFFGFGRFNRGGLGGGQTREIRRVYVSNDSPTQLSTLDPFLTSRFQAMLSTMKPAMSRFSDDDDDDDDDSPPSPPSKPGSSMITRRYYIDGFPAPFPSKVEPPKAPRYDEYHKPPPKAQPRYDEYYKPPPRANPPMIPGGYYGDGYYPPRRDPAGGNPVNVHVNLTMGPQGLQAPNANSNDNANRNQNANSNQNGNSNDNQSGPPGGRQHNPQVQGVNYIPNGYYDSQTEPPGWRPYNPQVQGVNYNPNGYYDSQTGPTGWRQNNPQVQGGNYNPNGYYNSQTGGGDYNPQVQGGNKVNGDGKITLGPEIGNINMGGGKAGGGQTGGGNYNANSNYNALRKNEG